jgi:hypothetical protein
MQTHRLATAAQHSIAAQQRFEWPYHSSAVPLLSPVCASLGLPGGTITPTNAMETLFSPSQRSSPPTQRGASPSPRGSSSHSKTAPAPPTSAAGPAFIVGQRVASAPPPSPPAPPPSSIVRLPRGPSASPSALPSDGYDGLDDDDNSAPGETAAERAARIKAEEAAWRRRLMSASLEERRVLLDEVERARQYAQRYTSYPA